MYEVTLGTDVAIGKEIPLTDIDRRSGLYVLGVQGSGKTTLLKSLIFQDILNGHGVFFLDPHGDAIDNLLKHIPEHRKDDVYLLDPADVTHAFGINLVSCLNPDSLRERSASYAQAEHIFTKLFANPQTAQLDILLGEYLPNSIYPLLANQGYTILELSLLLRDKAFRDQLLKHPAIPAETLDFWRDEFEALRQDIQREETASTRRRINLFRTHEYVKHIVGQSETTVNFTDIMDNEKILFVKLSGTLAPRVRDLIGTMLLSNLVNAVLQRERIPEAERRHFCVFVDEFQYFADSKDFDVLYTQGRKYAVTTTIAHQERSGQLAGNQRLAGAIDTAGHKVFLQQTRPDAERHAPEVAKASPTHIRQERQLGISQQPFADLLLGHTNPDIYRFAQQYLRPLQHRLEDTKEDFEAERLLRDAIRDEVALLGVDEQYERETNALTRGRALPQSHEALGQKEQALVRSHQQTLRLIHLHEHARDLRLSLRSLNTFLTAIMEGAILPVPGEELFSHFLLAFARLSAPVPEAASQAFALYTSLRYGSPELPRSIPITLAARYQAVSHEELYRHVEAQYIHKVRVVAEERRQELQEEWDDKRQEQYEQVLRKILTWKREARLLEGSLARHSNYMQALKHAPVRKFLTPYLFAHFTPPWYCGDPNEPQAPLHVPSDVTPEVHAFLRFLHQYGQGGFVVMALLRAAFRGQGEDSTNASEPSPFPPAQPWHPTPHYVLNIRDFYPHLHMLELPAIAGMEPFQVWQAITELNALLLTCGSGAIIANEYVSSIPPVLRLEDRHDALLLMEQVETDFPNASGLRSLWSGLTEEDIQFAGRNRYRLAWVVGKRYNRVPQQAKDEVYYLIADYKKKQPRQLGQMLTLPYALERTWYRCDEMIRTYLIARACDLVTYGDVVADRTFPQPTLPGIPAQEVSATVAVLVDMLLAAQAQENASEEREWAGRVDELVRQCLWKRDGLLHLQVYQAEGRVHLRQPAWRYLPPRVLTHQERTTLTAGCLKELASAERAVAALDAFVEFCQLLRLPENHVRTQTAQYVEREVKTYPTREMGDQMARELMDLPIGFAYVKSTWTGKIQTPNMSDEAVVRRLAGGRSLVDAGSIARQNAIGDGILMPRSKIEAEIRARQEQWRKRGGNAPPPPTSTGGNSPPSLPPGGADSDPDATTYERSEKRSEKKPPQTSNWVAGERSQIIDQPRLSPEKAPAQKPTGSSKGRKEGAVQKRRTKQKTGQEAPKQEEIYASLQEKLIPIVQQALVRYEEQSKTEIDTWPSLAGSIQNAAICAIALRDTVAAKRLLSQFVEKNLDGTNSIAGRLYILTGDEEKAKGIIQSLEKKNANSAATIAIDLPDKTIAKRLIRAMAEGSERNHAAALAIQIGDKEVIARMIQLEEQSFNAIHYETLQLLVSSNPERVKKLLKRHQDDYQRQGLVALVGEIAALRGNIATAKRAMQELQAKEAFSSCCDIAAIMGDVQTAVSMMWAYRKKDVQWFNANYEHLRFSVSWHNPQARYSLLQALQKEGYAVGLIAARLLEHLGSVASYCERSNPNEG